MQLCEAGEGDPGEISQPRRAVWCIAAIPIFWVRLVQLRMAAGGLERGGAPDEAGEPAGQASPEKSWRSRLSFLRGNVISCSWLA